MIKLFEIIFGWFVRKSTPSIKLACIYDKHTNTDVYQISIDVMNDIKHQSHCRIQKDHKLLKKVNDRKFLMVEFKVSVPIGMVATVNHLFYWDGETLFSCTMESKEMARSTKIDGILN